jgi:putative glutamine amidotransferase
VFGGSLYQDIPTQHADTSVLHDGPRYCGASHAVQLSHQLREWYGVDRGRVNSAHHQGIKSLGAGLQAQAYADDGICEAFASTSHRFVHAVQWHPEFHDQDRGLLSEAPLMHAFIAAL